MIKYDSRSSELSDTHAIPSIDAAEISRIRISDLASAVDFSEFNRVHRLRYDKMKFVLEQNGIQHRM